MDPFLDEERQQAKGFDPLTLLRIFWRRKFLFLVPFVLCLAMAFVAVRTLTPIYESSSQIRVVQESTSSLIMEDGRRGWRSRDDIEREKLANIWTIVTAPKFLNEVVRITGLHQGPARPPTGDEDSIAPVSPEEMEKIRERAEVLGRYQIRVEQAGNSIFDIAVRDPDPRQALVLARVVMDKFLEEEQASRTNPRTSTRDFLENQRTRYAQALQSAEDSLSSLQRSLLAESLVGNPINAGNVTSVENNVVRMRDQFYSADVNEMDQLEMQVRAITSPLPDIRGLLADAATEVVAADIYDLLYASTLGSEQVGTNSSLGRARIRLNSLIEQNVAQEFSSLGIMNQNKISQYLFFMVFRSIKERIINEISAHIRNYRDFATRQPEQSAKLQELEDEVETRRELLDSIEREISQQTINLEASLSEIGYRIEIRRDPVLGKFPVEPDKIKLYLMGFVLSLAIGFGLVVLSVMLDRTFTAVEDIERALSLTVIGTLPVIQDEHFKRKRRWKLARWLILVTLILAVAGVFLLYIYPRIT